MKKVIKFCLFSFLMLILIFPFTSCSDDTLLDEIELNNSNSIKKLNKTSKKTSKKIGDEYYNSGSSTNLDNSKWMSSLSDSKRISEISIPGTHETFALYGGDLVECQSMSIEEQLKAGIRFLDVRCRLTNDVFTIHHDIKYQNINFGDVIIKAIKFLKNNPTETVFMRIKQEYSTESDKKFINVFNRYISNYGLSNFYAPKTGSCNYPKNLGEIRGKIVIIENVKGLSGIKWGCIKKQDEYYVPTMFDIDDKYSKVKKHIKASNLDNIYLYLNFTSGSSTGAYPYTVASYVNYYLLGYLKTNNKIKTGIVAMDYPGDDLIQSIINTNF